jgi:iron complex transport system permease protein
MKHFQSVKNYHSTLFLILSVMLLFFFIADILLGSVKIPFSELIKIFFSSQPVKPEWKIIVFDFRLPKAIAALVAGIGLSVSGLQMQTIFRNPLAGPYVLGISSGASLGVALLVLALPTFYISAPFVTGNWAIVMASWIGAGLTLLLILAVSSKVRDIFTVLILGIMIGSAISSAVSILQYFGSETLLKSFIVWTFGSLGHISRNQLVVFVPCIIVGLLVAFYTAKKLDALLLGEKYATSMGLHVRNARFVVFLSTSILAGSVTAFCGPIGFVGIVVPQLCKMVFKTANHKILISASMLVGAIALLLSDIVSQIPGYNITLPINSITALLGIPFIIWIIIKHQRLNTLG